MPKVYFLMEQQKDNSTFVICASLREERVVNCRKKAQKLYPSHSYKQVVLDVNANVEKDVALVLEQRDDESVFLVHAGKWEDCEKAEKKYIKENPKYSYSVELIDLF